MKFSLRTTLLGFATVLLALPASAQINFDPVAHAYFVVSDATINTDISGNEVLVGKDDATNFNTLAGPITLTVATGAKITADGTHVYPDGNTYFSLHTFGSNTTNIEDGSVSIAYSHDTSTVNINGGVLQTAYNFDNSFLNINGGSIGNIEVDAGGTTINGGTVTNVSNYSAVNITGGTVTNLYGFSPFASSVSTLMGGNLTNIYQQGDDATFDFYGLSLGFSNAVAGTDPGSNVGVFYDVDWVRSDGVLVNATYFDFGGDVGNATPQGVSFTLVAVPEPGSLSLFGLAALSGLGCIAARRRSLRG